MMLFKKYVFSWKLFKFCFQIIEWWMVENQSTKLFLQQQTDKNTFPLVLSPDPSTAMVVHPIEHLRHPTEMPAAVHGEEEEHRTLDSKSEQRNVDMKNGVS